MHGAEIAQALNISRVIIPAYPGIGSAFGMLSADVRHDYVRTHISLAADVDYNQVETLFHDMEEQAVKQLALEGFTGKAAVFNRLVDMRYLRQAYEITVPLTKKPFNKEAIVHLVRRFHESHTRAYGYAREKEPVELINMRIVALGKLPRLNIQPKKDDRDQHTVR